MNKNTLLTANEVGRIFSVHPNSVRKWAREGTMPAVRLPSGGYRFRLLDVKRSFEKNAEDSRESA